MVRDFIKNKHFAATNLTQQFADIHETRLSRYIIEDKNEDEEHNMPGSRNIVTTEAINQSAVKLNGNALSDNDMKGDGGGKSEEISPNTLIKCSSKSQDSEDESEDSEDEEYREVSSAEDESEEEAKPKQRQKSGKSRTSVPSKKRGATHQQRRKSFRSGPPAKRPRRSHKPHMEYDDEADESEEHFGDDDNSNDEEHHGEYVPRGTSSRPKV